VYFREIAVNVWYDSPDPVITTLSCNFLRDTISGINIGN
jgi:hypothetical protein